MKDLKTRFFEIVGIKKWRDNSVGQSAWLISKWSWVQVPLSLLLSFKGSVKSSVECLTDIQVVKGSTPLPSTLRAVGRAIRHLPAKEKNGGLNPSLPSIRISGEMVYHKRFQPVCSGFESLEVCNLPP